MNSTDRDQGILLDIARYYSEKLVLHGETARGVDWNGEASQTTRFVQLCQIIDPAASFTINDIGCGYGALYDFLLHNYEAPTYLGIDVSESMIHAARTRLNSDPRAHFEVTNIPPQIADYGVASGIFNVRLNHTDSEWSAYLEATLDMMHATSRKGFAFNCLTTYSDTDKMRDHLYYADPAVVFDSCKRRYSRHVALLHDYGLYEFTILVRKQL